MSYYTKLLNLYHALSEVFVFSPRPEAYVDPSLSIDLTGKVVIVTGGASGCGYEASKEFLARHAKVYVASRNEKKSLEAIEELKDDVLKTNPKIQSKDDIDVHFLKLDLADLTTIPGSAKEFLSKESRLDILINNAGVMFPPAGSVTAQGFDLQFGTNVIGHYAFTVLLLDLIKKTAAESKDKKYNRIVFTTSAAHHSSPEGLIPFNEEGQIIYPTDYMELYGMSKSGNIILTSYFNRLLSKEKIRVVAVHPGYIRTNLQRYMSSAANYIGYYLSFPQPCGSINLMYASLSDKIKGNEYIIPWSYHGTTRPEAKDTELEARVIKYIDTGAKRFDALTLP